MSNIRKILVWLANKHQSKVIKGASIMSSGKVPHEFSLDFEDGTTLYIRALPKSRLQIGVGKMKGTDIVWQTWS